MLIKHCFFRSFLCLALVGCSETGGAGETPLNGELSEASSPTSDAPLPPLPPEQERVEDQKRNSAYRERLAKAPEFKSEIRTHLISNANANGFYSSYVGRAHRFRGLTDTFRCLHSPKIIKAISSAGWELVRCSANDAVFMRKHEEAQRPFCGELPKIPEIYETLIFYPYENSEFQEDLELGLRRLDLYAKGHRLPGEKIDINHRAAAPFLDLNKASSREELIVIITRSMSDRVRFINPTAQHTISFYKDERKQSYCSPLVEGHQYVSEGKFVLWARAKTYDDMASHLANAVELSDGQ